MNRIYAKNGVHNFLGIALYPCGSKDQLKTQ